MKAKRGKMTIGTELKAIMEKEGFSGYRISKETGIDETYISKILHNRINPTVFTLNRILEVLGYHICFEKVSQRKEVKQAQTKRQKRR